MKSVSLLASLALLCIVLFGACEKESFSFVASSEQEAQAELAFYSGFAGNIVSEVEFKPSSIQPTQSNMRIFSLTLERLPSINDKRTIAPNKEMVISKTCSGINT